MGLSSTDLESIRAEASLYLPDSCEIRRPSVAGDGAGGQLVADPPILSTPCRFVPAAVAERVIGERLVAETDAVMKFEAGTDLRQGDQVRFGDRVYEVAEVLTWSWDPYVNARLEAR
jgi:hypothetical protein